MNPVFSQKYFLTAGECDAESRMPLPLLVSRLILGATNHANALGIGYARLITMDLAWVLSRVSIEIDELPRINEEYVVNTWIESTNRMFSERCFSITDTEGRILANARTTWAAINIKTRRATNPGVLGDVMFPLNPPECPVKPAQRTSPLQEGTETGSYTFRYCDIDFNRHVNTVRYIDVILNNWDLEMYDTYEIGRFDIAFHRECHFGDTVDIRVVTDRIDESTCDLVHDGSRVVSANIKWRYKRFKQ